MLLPASLYFGGFPIADLRRPRPTKIIGARSADDKCQIIQGLGKPAVSARGLVVIGSCYPLSASRLCAICHLLFVIAPAHGILPASFAEKRLTDESNLFVGWIDRFRTRNLCPRSQPVTFGIHAGEAVHRGSIGCGEGTEEREVGKEDDANSDSGSQVPEQSDRAFDARVAAKYVFE